MASPFLATEICINDPHLQEPSYRIAFAVAQLYHKNLTELDAVALMYCWLTARRGTAHLRRLALAARARPHSRLDSGTDQLSSCACWARSAATS